MRSAERSHSASATRDSVAATWNVTAAFFWLMERAWLLDEVSCPGEKVVQTHTYYLIWDISGPRVFSRFI